MKNKNAQHNDVMSIDILAGIYFIYVILYLPRKSEIRFCESSI